MAKKRKPSKGAREQDGEVPESQRPKTRRTRAGMRDQVGDKSTSSQADADTEYQESRDIIGDSVEAIVSGFNEDLEINSQLSNQTDQVIPTNLPLDAPVTTNTRSPMTHDKYTIGLICPLGVERDAMRWMLDKEHPRLQSQPGDPIQYLLGELSGHNVAIGSLSAGSVGIGEAATVATHMIRSFPSLALHLLVGIGGGVPSNQNDIQLGDVVVSMPSETHGGVIHYDLGRETSQGFQRIGFLNAPATRWKQVITAIKSDHNFRDSKINQLLKDTTQRRPKFSTHKRPEREDILFDKLSIHRSGDSCATCSRKNARIRALRDPIVFYGLIASGNKVVKNAETRDQISNDAGGALCFEMEAAGIMNDLQCIVIRGISDYCDSHKNYDWQPYAAATAAAFAKEVLTYIDPISVKNSKLSTFFCPFQPDDILTFKSKRFCYEILNDNGLTGYGLGLHLFQATIIDDGLFIGRETELDHIQEKLKQNHLQRKVVVLGGMGGIGKTQLAIAFAKRFQHSYTSIFWLNATSEVTLKESFKMIAGILCLTSNEYSTKEGEEHELVLQWLSQRDHIKWLLIFDNHDEPKDYDIVKYYPSAYHGSIIVTTRKPNELSETPVKVGTLKYLAESLQILETRSGRKSTASDSKAKDLAKRLDGHPLALATAGAFLKQNPDVTFEEYLQEYKERWDVAPRRPIKLLEYPLTLYTTWEISFNRLEREDPDAAEFLRFLAYFSNQSIWYELFHAVSEKGDYPAWFTTSAGSKLQFSTIMARLADYCFVEHQTVGGSYSMHVCVHDWTLNSLNKSPSSKLYWMAFSCVSQATRQFEWDSLASLTHGQLAEHANWLQNDKYQSALDEEVRSQDQICGIIWVAELVHVRYNLGEKLYEKGLNGQEQLLGPNHQDTLTTVNNLGALYQNQGKMAEAEEMYQRALNGKEQLLGPNHQSTLVTVNNLGVLYRDQGKMAEAEDMYQRAFNGKEQLLGPNHQSTLATVNNLGILYSDQGKMAEAEEMFQRAFNGREQLLGPNHQDTLATVNNLGILYSDQGKMAEAEDMYQRALSGQEQLLGPNHQDTLRTVNNLGNLYWDQGKMAEAEEMFQRAFNGREQLLGPNHQDTLATVNNLGNLYKDQGKMAEAEQMYQRALNGREQLLGPNHQDTLGTVNNLGVLYWNQGKMAEAEQMYQRALNDLEQLLGPNHQDTLATVNNLGILYRNQGKMAEAEEMFQRAFNGREQLLGPNHQDTLATVNNLGNLYKDQGKMAEAEQMYQRALNGREQLLGPNHQDTLATVNNLGTLYWNQGKMAEAEQMYQRALNDHDQLLGPNHQNTLIIARNLLVIFVRQERHQEAETLKNKFKIDS